MKRILFCFSLVFLIFQVDLKLPDEERQKFLDKLTKKITLDNVDELKNIENKFQSSYLQETTSINYDPEQIRKIIAFYDFPEEYNYLNDKKITPIIKNQQSCGCCWSHASTSALAYRYKLLDIDVDLSPQDGLSCYIKDCAKGNYIIDAQMNLVKNGTVTEGCLPFTSGDGTVTAKCPTSCKDGSQFKKYYSQNAYLTEDYYSQDTFYDIVILIMDQLTTKGPVVSRFDVYDDFVQFNIDTDKCLKEVYTYDGRSEFLGGHAVVIVGYGFLDGKYYWLIQNSWGDICDHGFVKIEFGQVGVEQVAFSEPYIKEEVIDPKEVTVSFDSISDECIIKLKTTSTLEDWENTLELNFTDSVSQKSFNHQCGTTSFPQQGKKLNCYYEYWNCLKNKGVYEFKASQSLGSENKFKLDESFEGLKFTFWGNDLLAPIIPQLNSQIFYVSEEGSKIIFYYVNVSEDKSKISPIYGPKSEKALSDCHKIQFQDEEGTEAIYCNIKKDELNYFDDKESSDTPIVYDVFCGYKYPTYTFVYKLNKIYYPVYRFKKIYIPETKKITDPKLDNFTAVIDIEGNPKGFNKSNMFIVYTYVEKDNKNKTYLTTCSTIDYQKPIRDTNITCIINYDTEKEKEILYDNIYFLPYTIPYNPTFPYEAIIEKTIKGIIPIIPPPPPEPSSSHYFKISYIIIGLFLLL